MGKVTKIYKNGDVLDASGVNALKTAINENYDEMQQKIGDAPSDDKTYCRKNGEWVEAADDNAMKSDLSNIDEAGKQKLNEVAMEGAVGEKLGDLSSNVSKLEGEVISIHSRSTTQGQQFSISNIGVLEMSIIPDEDVVGNKCLFGSTSKFLLNNRSNGLYAKFGSSYLNTTYHLLKGERYDIRLEWNNGTATLTINGEEVSTISYTGTAATTTKVRFGYVSDSYPAIKAQIISIKFDGVYDPLTTSSLDTDFERLSRFVSIEKNIKNIEKRFDNVFLPNPFDNTPFYYHFAPNGFLVGADGKKVVASQSLEDIRIASRLGFGIIEANLKILSDGTYICTHGGGSNNLGPEFGEHSSTLFADVDYPTICGMPFATDIDKNKSIVPTLNEFLSECKKQGIGVFLQTNENEQVIKIAMQYFGNNFIAYGAGASSRDYFQGYIYVWFNSSSSSRDSILAKAMEIKPPFIAGIGPTAYNNILSEGTFESFLEEMHQKEFLVGVAYFDEAMTRNFIEQGVDVVASNSYVSDFPATEIYDIDGDISAFNTDGTIENNIVTLSPEQSLSVCDKFMSLGKGYLCLRFNGSIDIEFGSIGSRNGTTSDGSRDIIISDYFLQRSAKLTITAKDSTSITALVYKVSAC